MMPIPLHEIAHGRSGDKGNHANIAIIAYTPAGYAWLRDQNRVEYTYATDEQALNGFMKLARLEGIIPALESAHASAGMIERVPKMRKEQIVIANLSGRGDKDVAQVANLVKL